MLRRNLNSSIHESLLDTPVVLLVGARQTGKSTLARELNPAAQYVTLDNAATLLAATTDPDGFIRSLPRPVVLDEVQHAPELFRAIKAEVDRNRRPGGFLLTGSANVMLLPRLSESLAGRMEIHTLWPLSQGELEGVREGFIDAVFAPEAPVLAPSIEAKGTIVARAVRGGYPEVIGRDARGRRRWFDGYTTTLLQRDVRDLANIEALGDLPRLLRLIAGRATAVVNVAALGNEIGIPQTSLKRYLTLLQATYLVQLLQPWFVNLGKRVVKSPKFVLDDSGILAFLTEVTEAGVLSGDGLLGPVVENFVLMELRKQIGWSALAPNLGFFRTHTGTEVDAVLERRDGRIVGIEVKAGATISPGDFRGLRFLRDELGDRFNRGVLLYTGEHTLPFGDRLWAMPIDALWRWGAVSNAA
jgi:hypothetical protein